MILSFELHVISDLLNEINIFCPDRKLKMTVAFCTKGGLKTTFSFSIKGNPWTYICSDRIFLLKSVTYNTST
jgi:hypothetical protein